MAYNNNPIAGTSSSSNNSSEWQSRLKIFTLQFIKKFKPKLNVYKNDADPGIKLDNNEINAIKTGVDVINAGADGFNAIPGVGSLVSAGVKAGTISVATTANKFLSAHKNQTHKIKAKNISKIFREIADESLKEQLIAACVDIFFSFQNQFTEITDNDTKDDLRGMEKLANDAVNRTFDYISKNKDENYLEAQLHHFITKGVIFGESKREPNKNIFEKLGHTLMNKSSNKIWYTTDLFENIFILKDLGDKKFQHYIISGKKEKDIIFGCRLPFEWEINELDNSLKYIKLEHKITEEKFLLTKDEISEHLKTLYKEIFENYEMLKQIDKIEYVVVKNDLNINKISLDNHVHYEHTDKTLSNIQLGVDNNCIDLKKISLDNQTRDEHTGKTLIKIVEGVNKLGDKFDKSISDQITINTKIGIKKPVWFNIKEPVKSFTGRTNELTKIHELIQSKLTQSVVIQAATISGLGGIGKTELARMYIDEYKKEYYNVMWIDSETNDSLKKSFINLSIEIDLPTTKLSQDCKSNEEIDIKIIVKNIYEFIGKSSSLIVFDNAESYKEIKDFLPKSLHPEEYQKPYILFTSRNSAWDLGEEGDIGMIKLYVFSSTDAYDYIKKSLDGINVTDEEINDLGRELGYLPLALSQAVSYIKIENKRQFNPFGIRKYLEMFNQYPKFKVDENRYQQTIMTTWNITIKKISENADALDIIQMMSFLSPDCSKFFKLFNLLVKDKNKLWDAIELLQKYSLIAFDKETDSASIHRLLQFAIRNQVKMNEEDIQVLDNSLDLLKSYEKLFYSIEGNYYRDHSQIENLMTVIGYASDYDKLIKKIYKNVYKREKTSLHLLAQCGNIVAIKKIVLYLKINNPLELIDIINKKDEKFSPLEIAIINGHLNVVKYLKENGATESDKSIRLAVQNFQIDIIKYLNPPDLKCRLFVAYLSNASASDNLNQLNKFFNVLNEYDRKNVIQSFNDNFNSFEYNFIFRFDKIFKSVKIMQFLIENNFQTNVKNVIVLIEYTIKFNHPIEIFKELVDKCPDKNSIVKYGKTLLHYAVKFKRFVMVEYLIKNGDDVNAVDEDNNTILHIAYRRSNLEIIKYLIGKGGKVDLQDNNTILHLVAENRDPNIISNVLSDELNQKLDINATNSNGLTPIIVAMLNKNIEVVQFLLNKKNEFNIKTTLTFTFEHYPETTVSLLHLAIAFNAVDIVKLIIEQDGLNVIDKHIVDGINGLHLAVLFKSENVMKHIIELKKLFQDKFEEIKNDFDKKGIRSKKVYSLEDRLLKFYKMTSKLLYE